MLGDKMRQVYEEEKQGERRVLEAERALAEAQDDASVALGAMERLVELDPDDHDTRFALAYKYSSIANYELAAMHYSRIPGTERSGMTWNNLGVAFDRLGLPIKAIAAFRKSEECEETLGMSNIAANLLRTGFLPEARDMLDRAFKIKNHHKNVDKMLSTVTENAEDEQKRETEIFESDKATLEFYRGLGRSLASPIREQIAGQWKGPDCFLDLIQEGRSIVATGSYGLNGLGLIGKAYLAGLGGATKVRDSPQRYLIEYKGTVRGRAIFGQITRKRADNSTSATLELLGNVGSTPGLVMWLEDGGNKIHVLERTSGGSGYRFYLLERKE